MVRSVLSAMHRQVEGEMMLQSNLQRLDKDPTSWTLAWNLVFFLVIAYSAFRTLRVFFPSFSGYVSLAFLVGAFAVSFLRVLSDLFSSKTRGGVKGAGLLFLSLIMSLLIPSLLQLIFLRESFDFLGRSSVGTTLKIAGFAVLWMLIGYEMQRAKLKHSNAVSLLLAVILTILVFSHLDGSLIINYRLLSAGQGDVGEASHLVLGESAVIMIILSLAFARGVLRYLIAVLGFALLFSMGGRTSLLAFLLSLLSFAVINKKSVSLVLIIVVAVAAALAALLPAISELVMDDQALSRMFLAKGVHEEGSLLERSYQFDVGLRGLLDQVYFGDPNILIERLGGMGTYMHNLLSAWQFFGFFSFLIMGFVIIYLCRFVLINAEVFDGVVGTFVKLMFFYSVFCILIGKYIGFNPVWLSIGLCFGRMLNTERCGAQTELCDENRRKPIV